MTRILNGYAGWKLPPGGVNKSHFTRAKGVIDRMDVVLTLKTLANDYIQLVDRFGWSNASLANEVTTPVRKSKHSSLPKLLSGVELEQELMELNAWDVALHTYARGVAARLTAAAASSTTMSI